MRAVIDALSLLTPFDIDKPKIRIGPRGDGGYVLVDDIGPGQAVLSYGIGTEYRFDQEFAAAGHDVFMFDHTIGMLHPPHPRLHFFQEGGAGQSWPDQQLYSIADHLHRHRISAERLIVKMDIEGAEFEVLTAVPDDLLAQFEQIVVEVHSLNDLQDAGYRDGFCRLFRKLNRIFTLFHVHANNVWGPAGVSLVGGLPVPHILELSYVRSTTVARRPSATLYPTSLDFPNVDGRDLLLWMFPFLPTNAHPEMFAACADRVELQYDPSFQPGQPWRKYLQGGVAQSA
jgi:hypothetical protein